VINIIKKGLIGFQQKFWTENGFRKSIFQKMMLTYFLILITSLLLIAIITSQFMQQQILEQRRSVLEREALRVSRMYDQLETGSMSVEHFMETVNVMQQAENVNISIIFEETNEMVAIGNIGRLPIQTNRPTPSVDNPVRQYFTAQFQGEEEDEYVQMLTVAVPLIEEGQRYGEILIYSPIANVQLLTRQINRIIMLSFFGITIPVTLLLYFFSKRFTRPLVDMRNAAQKISDGEYSYQISVNGNDEVSDLAISLNTMAYKIRNLEEIRKDLIANVSHELKTPITTVQNFIQGILDGVIEKEESQKYLGVALDETKRLGKLTNELMELSSFEKKISNLNKEWVNIEKLVKEVLMQLDFEMEKKDIERIDQLQPEVHGYVDRLRMKQVLINILNNAIRFTPYGGAIRVELMDRGDTFSIEVIDSGPGIRPEEIPFVYERFYKGDKSRKRTTGFGLGLTISKHIMDAHGGDISILSLTQEGKEARRKEIQAHSRVDQYNLGAYEGEMTIKPYKKEKDLTDPRGQGYLMGAHIVVEVPKN
jgi:signal transduction histidine kinase